MPGPFFKEGSSTNSVEDFARGSAVWTTRFSTHQPPESVTWRASRPGQRGG